MKKNYFSFLSFFWVGSLVATLLTFQSLSAQQPVDSTTLYYTKILTPKTANDLPEGYAYFKNQKEVLLANQDTLGAIYALRMLALAEFELGRIYSSANSAVTALELLDNASKEVRTEAKAEIGIYNHLGIVYRNIDQPQRAIDSYTTALEFASNKADTIALNLNIANVYHDLGAYDTAITILKGVYENKLPLDNISETAKILDNLGYIQAKAGYAEGLPNMIKALELKKEINNQGQLYSSYKHLTEYYKNAGELSQARTYALLGREAAAQVSVAYTKEALYQYLSVNGDPDVIEYLRMSDSATSAKLKQNNTFASIEYNYKKEQERTLAAKIAHEEERRKKSIAQFVVVCIALLAIGLFFLLRFRHKKEKMEQVYQTESHISKKVHDEVANDLYQIMAKIQTGPNTSEALLDDLELVYHKTRDISKENSIIDLTTDYGQLLIDLLQNYQRDTVNIITKNMSSIPWSMLDDLKKRALYRVLQELMTNMRKHSKATLVVVSATQQANKILVQYTDNGVGGSLKKGNGLRNTENRIRSVKGTIIFDTTNSQGFTAKISL